MKAQAIVPAVVVGTVLLFGASAARAKKKKKKKAKKKPDYACAEDERFDAEANQCVPADDDGPQWPEGGCEAFPWLGPEVDDVLRELVCEHGLRSVELLKLRAAQEVYPITPEGDPQDWPPAADDARALCIWDRIGVRVMFMLEYCPEEEGDGPAPEPEPEPEPDYPPYPDPQPFDPTPWEDPGNYPTPDRFHQVYFRGGDESYWPKGHPGRNSGSFKYIAQKAMYTAGYIMTGDLDLAREIGDDPEIWKAYLTLINCSPWNQAVYGQPETRDQYHYGFLPTLDQISFNPLHADVRKLITEGKPIRRSLTGLTSHDGTGGNHAYLWLPPIDYAALAQGEVKLDPAYWPTGDSKIMPPPEVLALGLQNVPQNRAWGCLGFEASPPFNEPSEPGPELPSFMALS